MNHELHIDQRGFVSPTHELCKERRLQPNCLQSYSGFFHMYDLGVSYTFHFHKKNTESSVIFLRNDVLILNGKENKEASAICFEIRILKKKNEELLRKVPSKIYEAILLWKKTKKKKQFFNILGISSPNNGASVLLHQILEGYAKECEMRKKLILCFHLNKVS